MTTEAALRGVEIFARLNNRQIARLSRHATRRQFAAGTQILRAGDGGVALFVIASGRVRITQSAQGTGAELLLQEMGAGEAFGEIALIDGGPRSADVTAVEDTECVMLTRWDFSGEMRDDPDIARALLPVLCQKIRRLIDQLAQSQTTASEPLV